MKQALTFIAFGMLILNSPAMAYMVGPPLSLEKLVDEADIIFKATAVSRKPVQDDWFKPVNGYEAWETEFKICSILKGAHHATTLRFRHYDDSRKPATMMSYQPQFYHFEPDRTYLVFAKKSEAADAFRQISPAHTGKSDQGSLLCANDKPVARATVKEAIWNELQMLLQNSNAKDATYAIRQLDEMSDESETFDATHDFDRTEVLKLMLPLMTNDDPKIAQPAIEVIGSHNPYLKDEMAVYWLATVGSGNIHGLGKLDPAMKNLGAKLYLHKLVAIADGKAASATRALAIRSLGLSRDSALRKSFQGWLKDTDPAVRAAATLVLADFPDAAASESLRLLATDPSPEVRTSAAYAIGFAQLTGLGETLGALLADKDTKVRRAASESLLSFSPKHESVAKVLRANLANDEFSPLFLNTLAIENPGPYLDAIAKVVVQKPDPKNWSGGQIPCFTAWNILFKYLQSQPTDDLRVGKFDRYLDAMEKGYVTGSSEPCYIYAFYLQRGMAERAKKYRAAAKQAANYDLDVYFNRVDQNPAQYTRE